MQEWQNKRGTQHILERITKNRENDIDKSITLGQKVMETETLTKRDRHCLYPHMCVYTHKSGLSVKLVLYVYNDMIKL